MIDGSPRFRDWLAGEGAAIAFTTYQFGRLFLLGLGDEDRLRAQVRRISRCQGMWSDGRTLWVGGEAHLLRLDNALADGARAPNGPDRLYLYEPRQCFATGDVDIHDIAVGTDGRPVFVNTAHSCLAEPAAGGGFRPLWSPPFVTELMAEDRCHLNGLALGGDGRPAYVTALTTNTTVDGAPVQTVTTGSGATTTSTVTVSPTTSTRVDDPTWANPTLAEVPLVQETRAVAGATTTVTTLQVSLPSEVGVTASGPTNRQAPAQSGNALISAIDARTTAGSTSQSNLTSGSQGFLSALPRSDALLVRTLDFSATTTQSATVLVAGSTDNQGTPTALVINTGTTSGSTTGSLSIQLDNVEFVAVIGDATLTGDDGNDTVSGGAGNDLLYGGEGADFLGGDDGNDTLNAGTGNDAALGGAGNGLIGMGAGDDLVSGEAGDDTLFGGAGNDLINGGAGTTCSSPMVGRTACGVVMAPTSSPSGPPAGDR